jgi:hypothetical protein
MVCEVRIFSDGPTRRPLHCHATQLLSLRCSVVKRLHVRFAVSESVHSALRVCHHRSFVGVSGYTVGEQSREEAAAGAKDSG